MDHLDYFLAVLLRGGGVPLEGGAGEDGEAGDRGGGQRGLVLLASEGVEDEVLQEEEEALGGGGLGSGGAEHEPAAVQAGRAGRNLRGVQ